MEQTRQVFLGDASLATGFRLAGFEVHPDADAQQLDALLEQLQATRTPAFVVIDQQLAESGSRRLDAVRLAWRRFSGDSKKRVSEATNSPTSASSSCSISSRTASAVFSRCTATICSPCPWSMTFCKSRSS